MCRHFPRAVMFAGLVAACSDSRTMETGTEPGGSPPRFAAASQSEDAALQQLLATLPEASHARVRESFTRTPGRYTMLAFPNDPQRQALVDRIYAERRRADSRELAQRRLSANPKRVPVVVVLMDRLPDAQSRATVLRRRDMDPNDVIVLARGSATGDHLAAAVASLQVVRKQAGQYPSSDATISVQGDAPTAWVGTEVPRADRILARLRETQPREVHGVGNVPAVTLWLKVHR